MAEKQRISEDHERGQALILFSLLGGVLILFVMMVVDVGFLLVEKTSVQNAVDAAALAGAQELPDDANEADQVARDYAEANGLDPDALTVTFECTSTLTQVCNASAGTYDTIYIEGSSKAPAFFGGVLSIFGDAGCWSDGCEVSALAGACSGGCGATATEVDVISVIDHTGSMSFSDLQNAKDGARRLYQLFNDQVHQVGLGVTPPVDPSNFCDTVENWSDSKTWLPVGLSSDYQGSPGVLNPFSQLISTTSCLDRASGGGDVPGPHTDLGGPMKAAMDELMNNGRVGAEKGIVFLSDGAANIIDPTAAVAAGVNGPCDYAMKMASEAKAQGIEIYTIAYGADDRCDRDTPGTTWYNKDAVELLSAMATDADHYYYEPRSSDLDPVFEAIGLQLGGQPRLIK